MTWLLADLQRRRKGEARCGTLAACVSEGRQARQRHKQRDHGIQHLRERCGSRLPADPLSPQCDRTKTKKSLTCSEQKTKLIDYGQSPSNTQTGTGPM